MTREEHTRITIEPHPEGGWKVTCPAMSMNGDRISSGSFFFKKTGESSANLHFPRPEKVKTARQPNLPLH